MSVHDVGKISGCVCLQENLFFSDRHDRRGTILEIGQEQELEELNCGWSAEVFFILGK